LALAFVVAGGQDDSNAHGYYESSGRSNLSTQLVAVQLVTNQES